MHVPYRTIIVGARTQYVVKVSPEDYDFLMQWKWTYAVSHKFGSLIYARRSVRSGDQNVTILMHRVIITERMGEERPSDAWCAVSSLEKLEGEAVAGFLFSQRRSPDARYPFVEIRAAVRVRTSPITRVLLMFRRPQLTSVLQFVNTSFTRTAYAV